MYISPHIIRAVYIYFMSYHIPAFFASLSIYSNKTSF